VLLWCFCWVHLSLSCVSCGLTHQKEDFCFNFKGSGLSAGARWSLYVKRPEKAIPPLLACAYRLLDRCHTSVTAAGADRLHTCGDTYGMTHRYAGLVCL
jgi:hypothetical protein